MRIPQKAVIVNRMIASRLRQARPRGPMLAASLVLIARQCGRAGCRCQRGEKHPGYYITSKLAGKTRTVYVPRDLVKEVEAWIQEHRRVREILREITELSIVRVRRHVAMREARRGRS